MPFLNEYYLIYILLPYNDFYVGVIGCSTFSITCNCTLHFNLKKYQVLQNNYFRFRNEKKEKMLKNHHISHLPIHVLTHL